MNTRLGIYSLRNVAEFVQRDAKHGVSTITTYEIISQQISRRICQIKHLELLQHRAYFITICKKIEHILLKISYQNNLNYLFRPFHL